jgi:serine/threonine-protein kinase SRPK3
MSSNLHGKVLQNNGNTYILVTKLGEGSYASVWVCYYKNKNKMVAIKMFKKNESKSGKKELDAYKMFQKLKIKNTMNMYDNFIYEKQICIVLDLMIGSMYDILKHGTISGTEKKTSENKLPFSKNGKPFENGLPVDFVIKCVYCILESLITLHSNKIVHGDIKPENILLEGIRKIHADLIEKFKKEPIIKKISSLIASLHDESEYHDHSHSHSHSHDDESEYEESDDEESDSSVMSDDPRLITFSDSENSDDDESEENDDDDEDEENEHDENSGDENKEKRKLSIDKKYIDDPKFKLCDMGSYVVLSSNKKPKNIHTKYYRSPEILLNLDYDESCDIWALGCTMYELLLGDTLFNPDDYDDIDQKRCMLTMIYSKVGSIPTELIEKSPLKQVFYTENNVLKTHPDLYGIFSSTNIWKDIISKLHCDTIKKYLIVDLLFEMINPNPNQRIKAIDAIKHPLFDLFLQKHNK